MGSPWVCGEMHYLRTESHSLTAYLHEGRVVGSTLFDLQADPLEQSNLISTPSAQVQCPLSMQSDEAPMRPR